MSVASRNPFALLDGPYLISSRFFTPHGHTEDGLNPPAPEPAPATATTTDQPSTKGGQRGRGRGGRGSRGGNYYPRGAARSSGPREGVEDEGADDSAGKKGIHLF